MRNPLSRLLAGTTLCGALLLGISGGGLLGCDRNIEPFVPGEMPAQPDLRKIFPPGAEQAQKEMAPAAEPGRGAPPMAPAAPSEAAADAGAPVRGRITLAPAVASRAARNGILFIVARRGGAGPPLAVKRIEAPQFPLDFEIGPDDRMIQAMPFSGPLELTARLDGDGNASTRSPGDLQGAAAGPVDPGAGGVEIVLGEVL